MGIKNAAQQCVTVIRADTTIPKQVRGKPLEFTWNC